MLQVIIRPQEENEAFEVYLQFGDFPNTTYYDFKDSVPKPDLSHLAHTPSLAALAPEIQEELLYTVTVPANLTKENGTYWIGIKLLSELGTFFFPQLYIYIKQSIPGSFGSCRLRDNTYLGSAFLREGSAVTISVKGNVTNNGINCATRVSNRIVRLGP